MLNLGSRFHRRSWLRFRHWPSSLALDFAGAGFSARFRRWPRIEWKLQRVIQRSSDPHVIFIQFDNVHFAATIPTCLQTSKQDAASVKFSRD